MEVIDSELLNSVELQPLQQLVAVRMAISICESEDVQGMIRSFSKTNGNSTAAFSDDQWKQLCGRVRNNLDQIGVAKSLIEIILEKMWPISFEIFKWILSHDADTGIDSSSKFHWTPLMSINYTKTTELLIKTETVDIKSRFKLACFYCLEQEVRSLWEKMSLSEKRLFFARGNLKKPNLNPIVLFWTYYIQEVPTDYWESKALKNTQLFKYAVENGHLYATRFFLGKFKTQMRNRMILNCFNKYFFILLKNKITEKSSHYATAYFLLSQLNAEVREPHFFFRVNLAFRYFLEWPLQKHFISSIDRFRRYTKGEVYCKMLKAIFEKDVAGFKDHDYKKLFMEFWLQFPRHYKVSVNSGTNVGFHIFLKFVKNHFGFVFDESSDALKAKFRAAVSQRDVSEVAYFEKEDIDFFKFLIRERVTTKESIHIFSNEESMYFSDEESESSFSSLLWGDLMSIVNSILGTE